MVKQQADALRLADELATCVQHGLNIHSLMEDAAAELRRLHYENKNMCESLADYEECAKSLTLANHELLVVLQIVLGKDACGALVLPPADRERIEAAIAKATGGQQ